MKHPWVAQILVLLIISLSLSWFTMKKELGNPTENLKIVQVKVQEDYGEIVSAIEALNRPDAKIEIREALHHDQKTKLTRTIYLIIGLGIILWIHNLLLKFFQKILNTKKPNKTIEDNSPQPLRD